ncbi:hypothetical protein CEE34_06000 [Candidatus Aerophobetes bacterium Ae_b3a]|nr:MAG: hypothetical protein CEE34_06000 [Candidatus Aerophobetes bacterium Ae_b3a]
MTKLIFALNDKINTGEREKKMKCAIYARVSTEEQAKNYSIPAQLDLLRSFAQANEYEVFKEYIDEGVSGTTADRPQLGELLDDARTGMFNVVLVYRIDRFFRNTRLLLVTVEELKKFSVSFKSLTEPFDTSNPMGEFMVSLLGCVAQLERDTFIERSRMGTIKSVKEGHYMGGGRPLYGYTYDKESKTLEINDKEAKLVRLIYQRYLEPYSSLKKVNDKINDLGYRTRKGTKWHTGSIHDILTNTSYYGKWYYNPNHYPEPIEVDIPAIVAKEKYDKAQKVLQQRKIYAKRNNKYNYLLLGVLRCGICGRSMSASTKQCVKKKGGKEYGPYLQQYYYCFGRMLKKGCPMRWVRKDRLDPLVWNKIKEIVKNPALIRKAIVEKEKRSGPTNAALKEDIKGIDKKIKDCESERQKILRVYRKGIIGESDFVNQIKELQEEKDALNQQRKEIELRIESQVYIEDSLKSLENFVRELQERIDNLNFEERRELIKLLVRRVIVKEDGVVDVEVIVPQVDSQPGGKGESHEKQPTCFPSIAQLRHISW